MAKDRSSWLGHLLAVVPGVPFSQLANEAFREIETTLTSCDIDPVALRRAFNRTMWNPFIRAHRDDLAFQL